MLYTAGDEATVAGLTGLVAEWMRKWMPGLVVGWMAG